MIYIDTSAFVKRYHTEEGSEVVKKIFEESKRATSETFKFFPVTYILLWASAIAGLISSCIKLSADYSNGFQGG